MSVPPGTPLPYPLTPRIGTQASAAEQLSLEATQQQLVALLRSLSDQVATQSTLEAVRERLEATDPATTQDMAGIFQALLTLATKDSIAQLAARLPDLDNGRLPVEVSGLQPGQTDALTNLQLRATPVAVNTGLEQGLTFTQILTAVLKVDAGLQQPLTIAQLLAQSIRVDTGLQQPLTIAQLWSQALHVDTGLQQPLTLAQLLGQALAVTASSLPLPTGAATDLTLSARAAEATQLRRLGGGKTPVCKTLSDTSVVSIATPPAGKRIRVYWISAIGDPGNSTAPTISLKLGVTELYRVYAVSHWEVFEGAADEALTASLSTAGIVQVTAHIEIFQ